MNLYKIYNEICGRGKENRVLRYKEKHHILPKCLGGSNSPENITQLTAKEHYICHKILTKIYPNSSKLLHAFGSMVRKNKKVQRNVTSRMYEEAKMARSIAMKLNNPMSNLETRKRMSETRKRKFLSGELLANIPDEVQREMHSKRMIGNKLGTIHIRTPEYRKMLSEKVKKRYASR